MASALTIEESKALLALCRTGRLYEIEDWIRSGNSLQVAEGVRRAPLQVAVEKGFVSLVELLARNEGQIKIKNKVLAYAVEHRRMDLAELLVRYGAEISSVPFADVLRTWDRKIIRFFLGRGADIITDRPFAEAFGERVRSVLKVFKECQERYPELASALKQQAERALRFFSYEGNLKWVNLMLWLGADPRAKGPRLYSHYEDDPECDGTAVEDACMSGKLEILRRFKLTPEADDLAELLKSAALSRHVEVIRYLLDLGAKPNDKVNGGSSALDRCLWHLDSDDIDHLRFGKPISKWRVHRTIDTITVLLKAGALWRHDDATSIRHLRRTLLKAEPELVLDLFKLLKSHRACTDETIREFLDTPPMQHHLKGNDWHLTRLGIKTPRELSTYVPYTLLARYDREKLYEQVWTQPMWKLAPEYKVSDVALAKTCRKLQIPLPGRGHWAKIAAGKRVRNRPPLPPFPPPSRNSA